MNLSLLSAVVLVMSGCTDDEFKQNNNIPKGNGIVFGANASYNGGPQTRTEYGDYVTADGNKSQEIKWLSTDCVDIYSPTSPTLKKVEYGITNVDENQENQAYLRALGDGLQWDRTSSTQSFYAIYPSKESMSNEAVKNVVSFENGVLKGYIPVNQQHTITKGGTTGWTAKPNMDYLYMAAVQKDYTIPAADANDGVSLHFVPLTTTLELTIEGPTEAPIASINVFANDGDNIAGYFSCNLTAANTTNIDNSNLNCIYESSATVRNMITISGYYDDGGTQKPLELASGESITFNVFLLPHTDLDNISVRIAGFNTASKTMSLAGVTLHPSQKTCVKVKAPQIAKDDENNWITGMDEKVLISQLSIPGTANSFSYNYNKEDGSDQYYKTQTALFEQQWNAGIRCFELRCPNNESGKSLDGVQLQCNRENLGITFGQAVDMIWEKVKNTGEFAMIMPAFESNAGRDWRVTDFADDLNQFFTDHSDYKYVTYGRELTVGDARGSLMFIARITSEEDGELELPTPGQGVFIDQWGSLKDNWARRGYPVDNWGKNSSWGTNAMEYYMINGNRSVDFVPTGMPIKGAVDYIHNTTRKDGSTGTAYIQDWARVVKKSQNYLLYSSTNYIGTQIEYSQYAYWRESLKEKQTDIWKTFELAIEDNNNQQGSTFYINCLDGYYVDSKVSLSYKPYVEGRSEEYRDGYSVLAGNNATYKYGNGGVAGNIDAFADDINNWFYNEILKYGTSNIYGPMNIVILDRVYEEGGGSYLPSVIINNNYRFPLITIDDVQGLSDSDASYTSGGNVIE